MADIPQEERFLRYQIKAIRRFQSLRNPATPQEAQRLALEWIHRFAGAARLRWQDRWARTAAAHPPRYATRRP